VAILHRPDLEHGEGSIVEHAPYQLYPLLDRVTRCLLVGCSPERGAPAAGSVRGGRRHDCAASESDNGRKGLFTLLVVLTECARGGEIQFIFS
jgi:hypothetical protein